MSILNMIMQHSYDSYYRIMKDCQSCHEMSPKEYGIMLEKKHSGKHKSKKIRRSNKKAR